MIDVFLLERESSSRQVRIRGKLKARGKPYLAFPKPNLPGPGNPGYAFMKLNPENIFKAKLKLINYALCDLLFLMGT